MSINQQNILSELNSQQFDAAVSKARVTRIIAGAGTGKTKTLIGRIQYLMKEDRAKTYFVAFTTTAAAELTERINNFISTQDRSLIEIKTCHSLGMKLIMSNWKTLGFTQRPKVINDWELTDAYIDYQKNNNLPFEEGTKLKACLGLEAYSLSTNKPITVELISSFAPALCTYSPTPTKNYYKSKSLKSVYKTWSPAKVIQTIASLAKFRKANNWFLFQDMISLPLDLTEEAFDVLEAKHILVDEVQDLNNLQHMFILKLQKKAKTLTLVGDPNQSIFGFQGSLPEVFKYIENMYPEVVSYKLETNYRSTKNILDVANNILAKELNTNLKLEPHNSNNFGRGVSVYPNQKETVITWIKSIVYNRSQETGNPEPDYSDIAILFRAHRQASSLEMVLNKAEIPYEVTGKSFFEKPVVQDIFAYMAFFYYPKESEQYIKAWTKIIQHKKYLGSKTRDEALNVAAKYNMDVFTYWTNYSKGLKLPEACRTKSQQTLWDKLMNNLVIAKELYTNKSWVELAILGQELAEPSWEDRFSSDVTLLTNSLDEATGFIDFCKELENTGGSPFTAFVEHENKVSRKSQLATQQTQEQAELEANKQPSLEDDEDKPEPKPKPEPTKIKLMTVHASKGREWDHVGIWSVGHREFPLVRNNVDQEEERRLCYVAVTRAKKELSVFTYASSRDEYKAWESHPILIHIEDLADNLLDALKSS